MPDPVPTSAAATPDWSQVETVCLDMDGTVLDLHFDNVFWLDLLPRTWGAARGLDLAQALQALRPRFDAKRGTLDWYCVDHWSDELGIDIPALKQSMRGEIRYLDGAVEFLDLLRSLRRRVILTTNAHPLSLRVKNDQTGLARHFDRLVTSHEFGVPKEDPSFWIHLGRAYGVNASTTLFVDDSAAVLAAARAAGVGWIYQVLQPDSTLPPHPPVAGIAGLDHLADLRESVLTQLSAVGP